MLFKNVVETIKKEVNIANDIQFTYGRFEVMMMGPLYVPAFNNTQIEYLIDKLGCDCGEVGVTIDQFRQQMYRMYGSSTQGTIHLFENTEDLLSLGDTINMMFGYTLSLLDTDIPHDIILPYFIVLHEIAHHIQYTKNPDIFLNEVVNQAMWRQNLSMKLTYADTEDEINDILQDSELEYRMLYLESDADTYALAVLSRLISEGKITA